jgi:alanyl-tRNA synthetase
VENFRQILHSHGSDVVEKMDKFLAEKKDLEKEVERLRKGGGGLNFPELIKNALEINGSKILTQKVEAKNMDALKDVADALRNELHSGIGILAAEIEGKAAFVCVVTDDLIRKGINAGDLVKKVAQIIGGSGGGRPHLATAGARKVQDLEQALSEGLRLSMEALK